MISGVVLVSVYGPHPEHLPTLDQIATYGKKPQAVSVVVVALSLVASDLLVVHCSTLARFRPPVRSLRWALYAALAAASCGSLTTISLKIVSTGARAGLDAHSLAPILATLPLVPAAAVSLITFAPLQLYLLNSSLGAAPVAYAVPVYQSLNSALGALVGGLVFSEFEGESPGDLLGFGAGMTIAVLSIALLSATASKAEEGTQQENELERLNPGRL